MSPMVDRPKVIIGAAVAVVIVLLLVGVGFMAGRAASDDNGSDSGQTAAEAAETAGPTGMQNGVPVGFTQSEEGALGAAAAWLPWLWSTPQNESPIGIESVLAVGVDPLFSRDGAVSVRAQLLPLAARVEMTSSSNAAVEVFALEADGEVGDDLGGRFLLIPVELVWDDDVEDWRISRIEDTGVILDPPLTAEDLDGLRVLRPTGSLVGGPLVEVVPGE